MRCFIALFVVVATTLSGCAGTVSMMESKQIAQIERGVSTRADLESALGPPDQVAINPDGSRTWTYIRSSYKTQAQTFIPLVGPYIGGGDTRNQQLVVILDGEVVRDYEFTDSEGTVSNNLFTGFGPGGKRVSAR